MGETKIPVIGTVRVGHVKDPVGLEGDMTASSRCMTFMERSSYSQAIELDQNFVTGLWLSNNYFDQRATWSFSLFRPDVAAATGYAFGDDQWGWQGRLTALPIYEDEGRRLLHVGLSGGWRSGTTNLARLTDNTVAVGVPARNARRRSRQTGHRTATAQHADTGAIASNNDYLMGLEALYIRGPFSLQAEYGWNFVDGAVGIGSTATSGDCAASELRVQRRVRPIGVHAHRREPRLRQARSALWPGNTSARLVRPASSSSSGMRTATSFKLGRLEVAARFSYVDLNDGTRGLTASRAATWTASAWP